VSRWFRMYDELLDDPKVQMLPAADFKSWVNLLCLASRNDGRFPNVSAIAFALRETEDAVSTLLERLLSGGLIERRSGGADGAHYAPYKWDERQYKSDTSTNRVKRFRERYKSQNETAPDTETEAYTEKGETNVSPRARGERLPEDWQPLLLGADTIAGQITTARGEDWAARAERPKARLASCLGKLDHRTGQSGWQTN
jgi:hypothetical protein